ncbi:MAG TPA: pyridoxal phosphate-dependent aminotransferase [Bryobacteraceae bacterium]|jgi:aspartate/methionine/tyrosine aminotransferase|nr:pyridoxal phosphate-dependent aminotransferase [Bryobacteraceae bacterium]
MFSARLNADLSPNAFTRLLRTKRDAGEHLLDLSGSNPTRAGISYPGDEILAALRDRSVLRYDPEPSGMRRARQAVAAYYEERGVAAAPEQFLLTASTSEAYGYLFKLLCDPGDEVLVPRPSYPLFDYLAEMESVRVAQYPLNYDGEWRVDFAALEAAIRERTKALVVVSPNNPTGSYLKREEMERLERICAPRSIAILSDEVFADYAFGPDSNRAPTFLTARQALTFVMSGLSKVSALPQMKLGWIGVAGPAGLTASAHERLEWIADTYLSVGAPVQAAAPRLLELRRPIQDALRARTRANLAHIEKQAAGSPVSLLHLEGGWCATLEVPRVRPEEEWTLELLRDDNVVVQPGYFYDFEREAFLILSLLTPEDAFAEGLRRLLQRAS